MSKYDLTRPDPVAENTLVRLQTALSTPNLNKAVRRYYDHKSGFAGDAFDSLGLNPPDRVTADDLLAVTLLDVSWKPLAVQALLDEQAGKVSGLLRGIDRNTTLWDDHGGQELANAEPLWKLADELPGVGPTTTSKLLARKRPLLIPITDSVVVSAGGTRGRTWETLRYCFKNADFRQNIDALRPPGVDGASLLRVFDVAIWMLYSESMAAHKARADVEIADRPYTLRRMNAVRGHRLPAIADACAARSGAAVTYYGLNLAVAHLHPTRTRWERPWGTCALERRITSQTRVVHGRPWLTSGPARAGCRRGPGPRSSSLVQGRC
jgi:hypothetical protein